MYWALICPCIAAIRVMKSTEIDDGNHMMMMIAMMMMIVVMMLVV